MAERERLDPSVLAELWDAEDPTGTAERLRTAMADAYYPAADELATQYARALSLAGRGDEADAVLGTVIGHDPIVRCRLLLERGRRLLEKGRDLDAVPLLERAVDAGRDAGAPLLVAEVEAVLQGIVGDGNPA